MEEKKITKSDVQDIALGCALKYKKSGIALSVGTGKTLLGIRYIDEVKPVKVLIVYPKVSIRDTWISELDKFGYSHLQDKIDYTTYLSLNKHSPEEYDLVILDEAHNTLPSHTPFLSLYTGRILGLTGTPPKRGDKADLMYEYYPIRYRYTTDTAVDDKLLNDYRIIVHMLSLSPVKDIQVKTKKVTFTTSEQKSYDYCTVKFNNAHPGDKQWAAITRMKQMQGYKTKENYVRKLLMDVKERTLVFANTQDQADRLSKHSYHSNNPKSEENLQLFKNGDITVLSSVLSLSEGINIPNLGAAIIMHCYSGNSPKFHQRLGRLLRNEVNELSTIHILCYTNTIDEKWVKDSLSAFDQTKIQYVHN